MLIAISVIVLSFVMLQLGALSVWVAVLSLALKGVIAVIFGIVAFCVLRLLWQRRSRLPRQRLLR